MEIKKQQHLQKKAKNCIWNSILLLSILFAGAGIFNIEVLLLLWLLSTVAEATAVIIEVVFVFIVITAVVVVAGKTRSKYQHRTITGCLHHQNTTCKNTVYMICMLRIAHEIREPLVNNLGILQVYVQCLWHLVHQFFN